MEQAKVYTHLDYQSSKNQPDVNPHCGLKIGDHVTCGDCEPDKTWEVCTTQVMGSTHGMTVIDKSSGELRKYFGADIKKLYVCD